MGTEHPDTLRDRPSTLPKLRHHLMSPLSELTSERKAPRLQVCSGDVAASTTPPGTPPPPPPLPEPPSAPASSSVLKILSSLKPGATNSTTTSSPATTAVTVTAPSANASTSKTASPLEHILQTLFGKKKSFDAPAREPAGCTPAPHQDPRATADGGLPTAPLLDPIVQQFGQFSRDRALEDEEDDRPYDPEEEYGPDRACGAQLGRGAHPDGATAPETAEREEVAYDPEDETILEEAKVAIDDLPNRMCADGKGGATERPGEPAAAPSLVEQQQMIEELNKQIEEQKRQVEEQEAALRQQRAAAGASMAHFSPPASPVPPPVDSGAPSVGSGGVPRPARKVLLPTPPSTAFQPGFPLPNDAQSYPSAGGRDPFSGPACASQDKVLGSSQYEDPRNAQFAEKSDHPAAEPEGDREPQCRPGEGAASLPAPGQRVGAPLPTPQGQREPAPRAFGTSGLHGPSFPGPRGPVPPFSDESMVSSSDGPRGPPPARFGAQKGPIPSLLSGPHGPPPYGDSRGPSPSHLGGPRGAAPQFEDRKDPHGEKREFQDGPYDEMAGPPPQFEGPEQAPFMASRGTAPFQFGGQRRPLLSQFKGPRGGPPPSQFGGQRGPPPGHFVGPRGPHPSQFEGPRAQAPNFMPGPRGIQPQQFEEQRVSSPPRFAGPRAPAPLPYGGCIPSPTVGGGRENVPPKDTSVLLGVPSPTAEHTANQGGFRRGPRRHPPPTTVASEGRAEPRRPTGPMEMGGLLAGSREGTARTGRLPYRELTGAEEAGCVAAFAVTPERLPRRTAPGRSDLSLPPAPRPPSSLWPPELHDGRVEPRPRQPRQFPLSDLRSPSTPSSRPPADTPPQSRCHPQGSVTPTGPRPAPAVRVLLLRRSAPPKGPRGESAGPDQGSLKLWPL
ncbi:death-inducer obliterator 1-like [Crocuta crocuta]